jgi:hypothetical protein
MLKGFIDLVFEHRGRYYLLDWKSNWLGSDDSAYSDEAMRAAVLAHRYDLQYALYLLALHRLLRARLPDYEIERHLGGAVYVFLRGCGAPTQGVFTARPERELIMALDQLFRGDAGLADSGSRPGARDWSNAGGIADTSAETSAEGIGEGSAGGSAEGSAEGSAGANSGPDSGTKSERDGAPHARPNTGARAPEEGR